MKTPPQHLIAIAVGIAISTIITSQPARAALIPKADNASALNLGAAWTGGVAPGTADIAVWNNTVTVNTNDDVLGAALSWSGIQVANPAGPITIPADGNTLTLGSSGINLFTATESLTLSNKLAVAYPQYWQVGNGQTLDVEGALSISGDSAILFSFDANAASQVIIDPTIAGTVAANSSGTLLLNGTIGNGTGAGVAIGTVNDVDFAALNASGQVVPGSTISGLYTANPAGGTPTMGSLSGVYDFTNTNSVGGRDASTYYIDAMRFNTPQTNGASASTYTYNGVGSWEIYYKSGSVMDVNTILMTTNLGSSYVVITAGGSLRIADGPNELLVYQNNPKSSLVLQSPITQRAANAAVSKLGVGTMEYQAACSYSGPTLIYGGTLLVDGVGVAGTGPISIYSGGNFEGASGTAANTAPPTILNGGTNSVLLVGANGQFKNSTNLTFAAGNTWLQFIYSNGIAPSTTTAPLLVTNGTLTASNTVNVNMLYANFATGTYPLIKYTTLATNAASSVFPFVLTGIQPHVFGYLSNDVVHSTINLVVTNVDEPLTWAVGNGTWDIGLTANWLDTVATATTYGQILSSGDNVVFNDSASGPSPVTVTLNTAVAPGSVTVNNNAINYTISGTGSIAGPQSGAVTGLTKSGTGTLTLATTNTFAGGLNINGGVLNFSTLNNLGSGAVSFGGGTLQYNGNTDDISTHTVTFNTGGGTINTAGQTVNYANAIGNSGTGGLTKTGNGTLTLNGTNIYSGPTFVNQGTLALGAASAISSSSAIIVGSGATLDTATGGANLALSTAAGQVLGGVGTVKGEISAPAGTVITPATNGVVGTLTLANDLTVNGGTVAIDISSASSDLLTVTGNLTLTSGNLLLNVSGSLPFGVYKLISYGGSLLSGPGSSGNVTVLGFSQPGAIATLSDATAGEIDLVIGVGAQDSLTWSGTGSTWDLANTTDWLLGGITSWPYTNGDSVRFDDIGGATPTLTLQTALLPGSVVVSNNAETYDFQDGTGTGAGKISGPTSFVKDGTGTLINETANTYNGPTTIKHGVLQIGNGSIGDIGTGNITNNASLVFAQGDANTHTVATPISGTGTVTAQGSSPLVFTKNNTYTGGTTISAGTLQIGSGGSTGSLGTGPVTNNATLLVDLSGTQTISNNISGTGPVAFLGSATVTYGPTNTYANNTYISNGIVKLAGSNVFYADGSAGDWLILDGSPSFAGKLDLNGHNISVNALSGVLSTDNGLIENNGGSVTNTFGIIGSATTTFSGTIEDNTGSGGKVALFVGGGANQTLDVETTAGNAYSGGTIVSNATLRFTASTLILNPVLLGTGPITLLGGTLYAAGYGSDGGVVWTSFGANTINIPTNQTGTIFGPARGNVGGTFTGSGTLDYNTTYVRGNFTGNLSAFTGQIIIGETTTGGNLGIGSSTSLGHVFLTNSIGTSGAATGVFLYSTVGGTLSIGELADDGSSVIESTSSGGGGGVAANFAVGSLNTSTNYNGNIIDTVGIIKVGTGAWTLTSPTLTYSGLTTVSNGMLVLGASATLPNSTPITIVAPGILDVSASGTLTLAAQTLQGNGKLNGSIATGSGTTVAPGGTNAIGTLTITNDLNLQGTLVMELNRTNSPANSDQIAATTVEAGGTLVVTNIGPDLHTGDTFKLFSVPPTGAFAVTNLPVTTANGSITYVWTNNLSLNGTIQVVVGVPNVNTNPATAHFAAITVGNTLQFTWAPDHQGWQLYTNSVSLASTNWFPVSGSSSVTNESITINPANPKVFFQLRYP